MKCSVDTARNLFWNNFCVLKKAPPKYHIYLIFEICIVVITYESCLFLLSIAQLSRILAVLNLHCVNPEIIKQAFRQVRKDINTFYDVMRFSQTFNLKNKSTVSIYLSYCDIVVLRVRDMPKYHQWVVSLIYIDSTNLPRF